MSSRQFVCHPLILSASMQDYCKCNQPFSLKLGVMIARTNQKNWLTFGSNLVPDIDSGSLSTSFTIAESAILDLLAFLIQSLADYHNTQWHDQPNKENPHFGSNPADIWIRIRINPEIWIRILDQFWLRFWPWQWFVFSEHMWSCCCCCCCCCCWRRRRIIIIIIIIIISIVIIMMPRPVGKGAISVAFVRPSVRLSVRPSVAYIANNSRTQRPSMSKFARKVPTFDVTRISFSRSKGQGH